MSGFLPTATFRSSPFLLCGRLLHSQISISLAERKSKKQKQQKEKQTEMARTLELKTTDMETNAEALKLPLAAEGDAKLTFAQLREVAGSMSDGKAFSLRYIDSDGDEVTIASDADLKEVEEYMEDERLESVVLLVTPQASAARAASAMQTQLRGLVTAMTKLTAKTKTKPTPANAMNLLVASLETMDVADEAAELATVKKELLTVLEDDEFRAVIEELSASDEFKDLADALVTAIYEEDAQAIEDVITARFDELLVFAQRVMARSPSLKPVLVSVVKSCVTGIVRYNDEVMARDGSDASSSSSSSSSSSCNDDQETVDVDDVAADDTSVHLGIICDGCEKAPLVGVRYKSLDVPNFDLCEECEASGKWVSHEPFIKITDPARAPKQKRTTELVHPFVTCDGCEMSPIVGIRYKSETANDFDLCESCEASGKWTETHGPFTKIEESGMMHALKFICRRGGKFGHHGKFGRHGHHGKFGHHGHHGHHDHHHHGKFGHHDHHGPPDFRGPPPHHHGPPGFPGFGPPPHHEGPHGFPGHGPPPHHGGPPGFPGHGPPGRRGYHGRGPPPDFDQRWGQRGPPCDPRAFFGGFDPHGVGFPGRHGPPCPPDFEHGRPPCPPEFERPGCRGFGRRGRHTRFSGDEEQDKSGSPCGPRGHHGRHGRDRCHRDASDLEARFIEDVTIEDGMIVEAGKPLRKMWKLVNDGERAWPDGCYMAIQRGNPMFAEDNESTRITLPPLASGEEFIAGVDLVAPKMPGRYTSYWRVCDPADVSFGHRFWIDIVVVGETVPEATPCGDAPASEEDSEMKDIPDAIPCAEAASDDDIEIIEAVEAQEAEAVEGVEVEANHVDAEEKADYEEALQMLTSMGFADAEKNLRALELSDGNVGGAVNVLLSE
ncbi:hypothetical protein BBJ28_00016971 [Nothophytophthora sp. Chile5]|nr:hypothetical protein BBJ28_00016971 [Nothophytophthora sp. Chile5]